MRQSLFIFILSTNVFAQMLSQSIGSAVNISPVVGDTLSLEARNELGFFRDIEDFQWAVFHMGESGSTVYAEICMGGEEGSKIRFVRMGGMRYLQEKIASAAGVQRSAIDNWQIKKIEVRRLARNDSSNVVAFRNSPDLKVIEAERKLDPKADLLPVGQAPLNAGSQMKLGVSYSVATYSPNFNNLQEVLSSLEDKYRNQGYNIPHRVAYSPPSNISLLSLKLRTTKELTLLLETGSSGDDQARVSAVSICATYKIPIFTSSRFLDPFFGLGIGQYKLSLKQEYNYSSRISPVDSSGGYNVFDSILIVGDQTSIGFTFFAGIEITIGANSPFAITLFAEEFAIPDLKVDVPGVESINLRLESASVGAGITFYF